MRIATWNMQGGVNTQYLPQVVRQTGANVMCLQECGNLGHFLEAAAAVYPPGGGVYYTGNIRLGRGFMECVYWPNPWTQGGVAVLSNVGVGAHGLMNPLPAPWNPASPRSIPWLEVRLAGAPFITVFSIHSPPVWFATLPQVCAWNNTQIWGIRTTHPGRLAVLGDFNADPTVWGFIPPPVVHVVRGPRATHQGGGLLDYAVTNGALNYVGTTPRVGAGDPNASDHFPQVFDAP